MTPTPTQALEPCPTGCSTAAMMMNAAEGFHVRYVQCGCGWRSQEFIEADGAIAETKAIAAWNRRHRQSSNAASVGVEAFDLFDMGYVFGMALRGQNLEDSRAVGRLLMADSFGPIRDAIDAAIKELGFDSFQSADSGICQAKNIVRQALASLSTSTAEPDADDRAQNKAGGLWYRRWHVAQTRVNELESMLANPPEPTGDDLRPGLERAAQWHDARCKGPDVFEQELHENSAKALRHLAASPGSTDMQALEAALSDLHPLGQEYDGDALREAAQAVIATADDYYTARNGRRCSIEGSDGEKCWIVPFDQFEDLRRALSATPATTVDETDRLRDNGQSQRIYREWPVYRSKVEGDPFAKNWPDWVKGRVAILGYREQGFRACAQPGGETIGSGAWGDLLVEYADGSFGVRAALSDRPQAEGEVNRG